MMNKIAKKSALLALIAGLGIGVAQAQEQVYVRAPGSGGVIVKNATGLCWRTGYWTPAAAAKDQPAGCECDKALMPAGVCEPKADAAKPAVGGKKITLAADALFDFDKAVLRPDGKKALDNVVAQTKGLILQVVLLVGHTDRIGSNEYNQKLSEKRAAAVKEYVVSKGLEANRVYTEGKGEKYPKTGDKCKGDKKTKALIDCLQPDRRVDVEIIANEPVK